MSEREKSSEIQKWEYCMLGPITLVAANPARIITYYQPLLTKFTAEGLEFTPIQEIPRKKKGGRGSREQDPGKTREDVMGKTISELGEESWELVGCGTVQGGHVLYFKRPKT